MEDVICEELKGLLLDPHFPPFSGHSRIRFGYLRTDAIKAAKYIMEEFHRNLEHVVGKPFEKLKWWNAVRIPGSPPLIAKYVPYDIDDPTSEERANKMFLNEVEIYKKLPSWWGVRYVNSFQKERILITTEYPNCSWKGVKVSPSVRWELIRQLSWLHSNEILHNDLEFKNILLSCDHKHAVIIDFEKSELNPTEQEKAEEMKHLLSMLSRGGRRTRKAKRSNRKKTKHR